MTLNKITVDFENGTQMIDMLTSEQFNIGQNGTDKCSSNI